MRFERRVLLAQRYWSLTLKITFLLAIPTMAVFVEPAFAADELTKPLEVSADRHFLAQPDGTPFFWLSDAAWSLGTRTKREGAEEYLRNRSSKGYTVIVMEAL